MKVATGSWTPVFGVAVAMDVVTALLALFVLKQMRAAYFGAQALPFGSAGLGGVSLTDGRRAY